MKQTFLLLAILALGFSFWYFSRDAKKQSLDSTEIGFAIQDTQSIGEIQMTEYIKGEKKRNILLKRVSDGSWRIDPNYPVLEPQMHLFLKTVSQLRVRQVHDERHDESAQKSIEQNHVHIEFKNKAGEKIKGYKLGQEAKDRKGSLMLLDGAEKTYTVELPGSNGYLTYHFPLSKDIWMENLLFDGKLDRIKSIRCVAKEAAQSFELSRENAQSAWLSNGQKADTTLWNPYLKLFKGKVYGEAFLSVALPNKLLELQPQKPDYLFVVTPFEGKERRIRMYIQPDNKDSYYGWIEGEDNLISIQYFVMNRYLRR